MKVLMINPKPMLAEALAQVDGMEVVGLWFDRKRPQSDPRNVRVLSYREGSKLDPRAIWSVRQVIQRERPDVVQAHFARALAHVTQAVVGMRGRPGIVSLRGIIPPLSWRNAGDWITYWHPFVDAHACESEAVRQALIRSRIAADKCRVVYNCVDTSSRQGPGRPGLSRFGIEENDFVLGVVARMRRVKGIDLLLRAAIECADLPDLRLMLFGGVEDAEIHRLAANPRIHDRVKFAGHRTDARELVSGSDVLVMPSRSEGVANALLEGMHQGVCPLISDVGGIREVVRHEQDGLIVPREDVSALVSAIRRLHADRQLVRRLATSAQQRACEFTPMAMAERLADIYRSLDVRRQGASIALADVTKHRGGLLPQGSHSILHDRHDASLAK